MLKIPGRKVADFDPAESLDVRFNLGQVPAIRTLLIGVNLRGVDDEMRSVAGRGFGQPGEGVKDLQLPAAQRAYKREIGSAPAFERAAFNDAAGERSRNLHNFRGHDEMLKEVGSCWYPALISRHAKKQSNLGPEPDTVLLARLRRKVFSKQDRQARDRGNDSKQSQHEGFSFDPSRTAQGRI